MKKLGNSLLNTLINATILLGFSGYTIMWPDGSSQLSYSFIRFKEVFEEKVYQYYRDKYIKREWIKFLT